MTDIFGKIENPFKKIPGLNVGLTEASPTNPFGLIFLFNNLLRLIFVIAGLFAFLKIILAGLQFINAGGDPKQIEGAWSKIWQSIVGLFIMVLSFGLAALFGILLFGDALAILSPKIYGPSK
jgi:hypothetical protein